MGLWVKRLGLRLGILGFQGAVFSFLDEPTHIVEERWAHRNIRGCATRRWTPVSSDLSASCQRLVRLRWGLSESVSPLQQLRKPRGSLELRF